MRMLYIPDNGSFRKIPAEAAYAFRAVYLPQPLVFDRWDFRNSKTFGWFAEGEYGSELAGIVRVTMAAVDGKGRPELPLSRHDLFPQAEIEPGDIEISRLLVAPRHRKKEVTYSLLVNLFQGIKDYPRNIHIAVLESGAIKPENYARCGFEPTGYKIMDPDYRKPCVLMVSRPESRALPARTAATAAA